MGNPSTTRDYLRGGKMSWKAGTGSGSWAGGRQARRAGLSRCHTSLFVHLHAAAQAGQGKGALLLHLTFFAAVRLGYKAHELCTIYEVASHVIVVLLLVHNIKFWQTILWGLTW